VAAHKRTHGVPVMQPTRVGVVRERARRFGVEHGIDPGFLTGLFDQIIDEACFIQDQIIEGRVSNGLSRTARRIDHVAIAVPDLDAAVRHYTERFGFSVVERRDVSGGWSGMKSATLRAAGVTFVLCQGDSPTSNVSQYIEHFGPGVQHLAIEVRDLPGLLEELERRDANLLTGIIHSDGVSQSFTRREKTTGMQLEFVTRTSAGGDGFREDNVRELFTAMERENVF
jgi:4-hydroxyphenylpyruvate dioxygenase-like putative hemolysin